MTHHQCYHTSKYLILNDFFFTRTVANLVPKVSLSLSAPTEREKGLRGGGGERETLGTGLNNGKQQSEEV